MRFMPRERQARELGVERVGDCLAHAKADVALHHASRPVHRPRRHIHEKDRCGDQARLDDLLGAATCTESIACAASQGTSSLMLCDPTSNAERAEVAEATAYRVSPHARVQLEHADRRAALAHHIRRSNLHGIGKRALQLARRILQPPTLARSAQSRPPPFLTK